VGLARRTLLKFAGLLPMVASQMSGASAGTPSRVKPRHVLCFLGGEGSLQHLADAAQFGIDTFATGFSVDKTYSQHKPDSRMVPSLGVCWDRVAPGAWTKDDEEAVANHKCVLYVLGPPDDAGYCGHDFGGGAVAHRRADQGGRCRNQGRERRRCPWPDALAAAHPSMW
jgi:hypothetical protein